MSILFALISYLGWGTGDIFGTIATRKIGGYSNTFWYSILQLIFYSFLAYFFLDLLKNLTPGILFLNIVLGVIGTISLVTFYEGLRISNASLVGTITGSFTALVVIFSIIFLKENITQAQTFSILVIFSGIIISSLDFKELRNKKILSDRGVMLAIITAFLWGVYWTFIKIPIREIGWFWPGMISLTSLPIILIFMRFRKIKLIWPSSKEILLPIFLNALFLVGAMLTFQFALSRGLTAIVAPIAGSYPTLFVLLAFLIFKDKITRQQIVGIVTTLTGIVLLSIFSI